MANKIDEWNLACSRYDLFGELPLFVGEAIMPVSMLIRESPIVLDQIVLNLNKASAFTRTRVKSVLQDVGLRVSNVMREKILPNRYTGALERSITETLIETENITILEIGPTLKRGKWDAGKLLEGGTGPNPHAPFGPIATHAKSKGLPPGAVWQKIRKEGTDAHPFIWNTYRESLPIIDEAVDKLGEVVVAAITE